jgi:hypothetical protein
MKNGYSMFDKILRLILFCLVFLLSCTNADKKNEHVFELSDAQRFALEYTFVGEDNIFVYKNAEETANILEKGRGIVFIGFKECQWCQYYAVMIHDIANDMEIDKIYYYDIREDRLINSEGYVRIVNILSSRLQFDDEGKPRVYVPQLSIVSRGRIITHDYETSKETLGYETPQEYWNTNRVNAFKDKISKGIDILKQLSNRPCSPC